MKRATDYFNFDRPELALIFERFECVWSVLDELPELVSDLLQGQRVIRGDVSRAAVLDDGPIYVGIGSKIEPGVYVKGPAYIGEGVVVRQGAYIRGDCVLLERSVLGHASEMKNSILLPDSKAPHFAYVGDSILGHRVNLGAGTKLSNVPLSSSRATDGSRHTISVEIDGVPVDTGLTKFGAILGDDVQVGCNAVLNPGAIVGPRSIVYPNTTLAKGVHAADSIFKLRQSIEIGTRVDVR